MCSARPIIPALAKLSVATYRRHRDIASRRPVGRSGLIDDVLERLEGLVEPLLAATILLVVGLRGNVAKHLFEVVLACGQHGAVVVIGDACSKYEPLPSGVYEA